MTPFPYLVEQDEHGVWHVRKIKGGECCGCIEADLFEILRAWFTSRGAN